MFSISHMPAVEQTFWLLLQETMTSSLTPALLTGCVALVTRFLTAAMVRSGPKPMVIGFWRHMGCYLGDGLSLKRVATSKSRPYIRVIWPLRVICGYRGHLKTTKCVSSNNNTRCTNKKGALCCAKHSRQTWLHRCSCTCTNFTR